MTQALRVAHIVSGDLWAGAEAATYALLAAMAKQPAIALRAIAFNEGELTERLRGVRGVEVVVEPESGRSVPALVRAVVPHLADMDLVHAHRDKESLIAAWSRKPWLATQHGRPEAFTGTAQLRARLTRAIDLAIKRTGARRVIAVSEEVAAWLRPRVGAGRVVVVPNGIADPAGRVHPPQWRDRPRRVGALGRLVAVKGFELAIAAVARCPGLELEIVGDGPERLELERCIRAADVGDRIRLVGFEADPLPRVAQWRALLVTSHHEGHPISVLEAMALGTPVVAGPLPGVVDALGGACGAALADRDPARWARAIEACVADTGEGKLGSRGVREQFLARFTADRAALQTEAVYRDALQVAPAAVR